MNLQQLFFVTFFLMTGFCTVVQAQKKSEKFIAYIDTYSGIAVEQMKLHKIPASITLAQGILESAAGQSDLARRSNNHFGIKCGSNWKGSTVVHHDDTQNECFRSYKKVLESYEDHSLFLVNRAHYSFLFDLDIEDYKGWAKGLKKAGYATDPSYASRLINLIETYDLSKYDKIGLGKKESSVIGTHQVYKANGLLYIITRYGDTFQGIGEEFSIRWKKIAKYNDLKYEDTLGEGSIIYLEKKNKQATRDYTVHIVTQDESMHSISQKYGIRLKYLYKLNRLSPNYELVIGSRLRVR